MRFSRLAFLALLILLPVICRADTHSCPWINKATAFGILGATETSPGESVSVNASVCSFVYLAGNITRELRITVEQVKDSAQTFNTYKTQCGLGGTPLRAIGNEAVACTLEKGQREQVFGRVRDSVFTISVSTSAGGDPAMSREALLQKAGLVAEQISGNLF